MLNWIRDKTGETDLVMIGDTTYDLEMAVRAGAHAIGVSWGHHSAARLSGFGPVADSINQPRDMLFEKGLLDSESGDRAITRWHPVIFYTVVSWSSDCATVLMNHINIHCAD